MPSRAFALKIAASALRHLAPLLVTVITGASVLIYLMLGLFDLGLGYSNHQLRKHWPELTTNAVAAAETSSERLFAHLQLPLMFVFGGCAFIFTAALALTPFVMAFDLIPKAWADLKASGGWLALTSIVMATLASYSMHLEMHKLGEKWTSALPAAEKGAERTPMQLGLFTMISMYALALGGPGIGLWLAATVFAAVQVWWDVRPPKGREELAAPPPQAPIATKSRRRGRS